MAISRTSSGDAAIQGLAFQKFHGDVRAALPASYFKDRADIGMRQRGSRAAFALESQEGLAVVEAPAGDEFDRGEAAQINIGGAVHRSHGAASDFRLEAVVADHLPDH